MRLISTAGGSGDRTWSFREALFQGQAPHGGLFIPDSLSRMSLADRAALPGLDLCGRATLAARHLLGDELPGALIREVVRDALDFPIPLREIEPGVHMLELFHGPTHAFKDVGARFMARMMAALGLQSPSAGVHSPDAPTTILVATSGDTGGAVAHAFHRVPGVRVVVLYPLGRVSPRQEAQFATLGDNIAAVAVRGAFDDCQRLVRQCFADPGLNAKLSLTSANSINIGRLLPQTFYYIHALVEFVQVIDKAEIVISVPSGNFGNLAAGIIARRALGMSLARFVAATNENSVVPDYLNGRGFHPRASVATLSSAMDVGNPSNFRRIAHLFAIADCHDNGNGGLAPPPPDLQRILTGSRWSDAETRACIRDLWERRQIAIDPHTAVGLLGLRDALKRRPGAQGIVLATAHPAKFAEVVEPLIGTRIPIPPGITQLMERPRLAIEIPPEASALAEVLRGLPGG